MGVKGFLTNSNLMFPSCRKKLICIVVVVVIVVCIVIALSVSLWWYFTQEKKEDKRPSLGGPYSRQAVATDTGKCSDIGNDTLNSNGSAVDAAIAAMFCLGVINMHTSGVGGGGVMLVYIRKLKKAKVIDFRETAPAATTSDMFPPTESGENMSKYGIYLVKTICQKIWEKSMPKIAKRPLPVDVHRSGKTSLLKLSIIFF